MEKTGQKKVAKGNSNPSFRHSNQWYMFICIFLNSNTPK